MSAFSTLFRFACLSVLLCACSEDPKETPDESPIVDAGAPEAPAPPPDCDDLMPTRCAMPWPSSLYLRPDESRATGYTLTLGETTLPSNLLGKHIEPAEWQRMDGYGPGEALLVHFPNLDITPFPSEWRLDESMADDAPLVWLEVDEDGARRIPWWAELDRWEGDPADKTLFVRPAVLLKENARYIVAFRNLRDTDGAPIPPSEAFAKLRDGATEDEPDLSPRQPIFDELLGILEAEGVDRGSITLAWDFHTASSDALHGPLLHMRDQASEAVGESGPELTVNEITEYLAEDDGSGQPVNANIAYEVRGTFRFPNYMRADEEHEGLTGVVMNHDGDWRPSQNGWEDKQFWARIPRSALDGAPVGLLQFGHGLLGLGEDVASRYNDTISNQFNYITFACSWSGMDEGDEAYVFAFLTDMTYFRWLADRMHQGMIESVLLMRGMRARFAGLAEVEALDINIDGSKAFYSGISQGGIYGGTYMALTTDVTYGHLGVPGTNYSTLLHRSVDFDRFFVILESTYRRRHNQAIMLHAIQLLWNGTDPISYWRHISAEPFPGNEPHYALAATARGDYQVDPVTMEVIARSDVGLALMGNYDADRTVPMVESVSYPHRGSALINWSFGNAWGPEGNKPPLEDALGDPHGKGRYLDSHNRQMIHFFESGGEVIDVCDGSWCPPESEREVQ